MALANILRHARQTPGKVAVVYNDVAYSYVDFARRIDVARRYFAQQNLPADSVAVIDVWNLFDAWILGLALRGLGLTTFVPREGESFATLGLRNISCVVTLAAENRPEPERFLADSPWRLFRVPAGFDDAATLAPVADAPEITAPPGNHIMMTSGTTGANKKVARDAVAEALAIPLVAEINFISDQSVVYVANIGLWTAGGYRWPLFTWSMGGTVVIHQAADQLGPLTRHAMTHVFTTPATLVALLRASDGTLRRNDAMRLMVTGGALSQALLAAAKRKLTRQVYSVLASTEASTMAVTPLEQPDDLLWHRIHPSREVQVVDDAGNVVGPGREGLVRVRIIDGFTGYLDDEAATREFFRDGYFYPGDLGMFGPDGRLSLRGRASDVVNVLGTKIATEPIERALQDRLGVDGVCILSLQDEEADGDIHVVIQSSRRIERTELEAARNAEMRMLKRVQLRITFVDKMPRNEMGKIRRPELKRQLILDRAGKLGRRV